MKKQYSVNKLIVLCVLFCVLLVSCKTADADSHKQIVYSTVILAEEYAKRGDIDQAIRTYQKASEIVTDSTLLFNESVLWAKLGEYEWAAKLCQSSYDLAPDKVQYLSALSSYLYLNGDIEKAKETAYKYLAKKPDDNQMRKALMKECLIHGYDKAAYAQAFYLWQQKDYSDDVINTLYEINPKEWEVMHKVLTTKVEPPLPELPEQSTQKDELSLEQTPELKDTVKPQV